MVCVCEREMAMVHVSFDERERERRSDGYCDREIVSENEMLWQREGERELL